MLQSVRMSKLEYAHRYDDIADSLYRLALYLLGDAADARYAMAEVFVEGYTTYAGKSFEQRMLAVLWQVIKDCEPVCGEAYSRNLLEAVTLSPEEADSARLFEMLGEMPLLERAVLLLSVLQRQPTETIAWLLELPQGEVSRVLKQLCDKVRRTMAA
ncbi:hypothetical protein ACS3UN_03910 [Oscillospiraceae bacterium LTW-04]|nr:hypothetical protein RBH76_06555 [Oscillospiraceae bacterium MB24-C1]